MYTYTMRTTLTLEDDVAAMLVRLQKEEKKGFKQLVNEVLRLGLMQRERPPAPHQRYSTPEMSPGPCLYPDLDNTAEVLAAAEGEDFR